MQEPDDTTPRADERPPRVLDARSLRGLAHPLRMQLLNALRRGGPATASRPAAKPGESSGATGCHLRRLAAPPSRRRPMLWPEGFAGEPFRSPH
ncbi:hypothetical protein GCM10022206_69020 [Streptomyces chiangmaiensis]